MLHLFGSRWMEEEPTCNDTTTTPCSSAELPVSLLPLSFPAWLVSSASSSSSSLIALLTAVGVALIADRLVLWLDAFSALHQHEKHHQHSNSNGSSNGSSNGTSKGTSNSPEKKSPSLGRRLSFHPGTLIPTTSQPPQQHPSHSLQQANANATLVGVVSVVLRGTLRSSSIAARVYGGLRLAEWTLHQFFPALFLVLHRNYPRHHHTSSPVATQTTNTAATATIEDAASASVLPSTIHPHRLLSESAFPIALILWSGLTLCSIKRYVVVNLISSSDWSPMTTTTTKSAATAARRLGGGDRWTVLLDRCFDAIIVLVVLHAIFEELSLDSVVGIQTLLSAGGMGALIFSLASRDWATELVGGVALQVWRHTHAIAVGDRVRLGEGSNNNTVVSGKVLEIGMVETYIQGYDNIVTRIPNSQMTKSRLSNLSRTTRSRLRQYLRFKHADIDKLPALLEDIKQEIKLACPKLVSDGSKSFHAVLTSFEADHIQGMVLAHFDIPPATGEFTRNRSTVVFAIGRTMKKHGVDFAPPLVMYQQQQACTAPFAISTATTDAMTNGISD